MSKHDSNSKRDRYVYTIFYSESRACHMLQRLDREEAYVLAMSGHFIEVYDSIDEASRALHTQKRKLGA